MIGSFICFSTASAVECIQMKIIEVFEGINGVEITYDDVLVTGRIIKEYDHNLHQASQ